MSLAIITKYISIQEIGHETYQGRDTLNSRANSSKHVMSISFLVGPLEQGPRRIKIIQY